MANHLHYGDNLEVLRNMPAESVDLIYLDPPFNSNASYNQLFKSPDGKTSAAQIVVIGRVLSFFSTSREHHFGTRSCPILD